MLRHWLLVFIWLPITLAIPVKVSFAQTQYTFKVGVIAPLSGPMAPYGKEVLQGAELALQALQETSPELARRIQLLSADDQSLAKEAEQVARDMLQVQRVDVLLGSVTSVTTMAIAKVAQELERPLIVPTATDSRLTQQNNHVFRGSLTDRRLGMAMARFSATELRIRRAAILSENSSPYSHQIASAFEQAFKAAGGEVVVKQTYDGGQTDFSRQIQAIRANRPQLIVMPGYYPDAAHFLQQTKEAALTIPVIGADGWDAVELLELTGRLAIGGHYFVTHFSHLDPDPKVRSFVSAFKKNQKREPSVLAAMGYDALMIAADAFQRANSNLPPALLRALGETRSAPGLIGEIRMDDGRQAMKPATVLGTAASGTRFHTRVNP